jgi:hypothetical protein
MADYTGTPIPTDQAWRTFGDWKSTGREIGVIFYGGSGSSLYTMGFVESARNGKLLLKGDAVRASFNLKRATFACGPIQTWPRWPSPPIVEVIAVQAQLENELKAACPEIFDPNPAPTHPASLAWQINFRLKSSLRANQFCRGLLTVLEIVPAAAYRSMHFSRSLDD